MKIYIACGLTHVPRGVFGDYCQFLHSLASHLGSEPKVHRVKYALVDSDPQLAEKPAYQRARLCYLWDREMVEESDLVIAEASFPSTGLGIELHIAESNLIPIVLCFRDFHGNRAESANYMNPDRSNHSLQIGEGFVSLMALGLPSVSKVIRYESPEDGVLKITDAVRSLLRT
jgi:hypothetical protein